MSKTLIEGIEARVRERDYRYTLRAADRMTERHIAVREVEEKGEPPEAKMPARSRELKEQFAESPRLESTVLQNLKGLAYGL